jgi:hypothetical protein
MMLMNEIAHLFFRGGFHIGLLTNNQEIVQIIRIRGAVWCRASGKTLYWVLLLVYVGASGDTLYWVLLLASGNCWFMWPLGQHALLGIAGLCAVLLLVMLRLGQLHTLLAIVVGLWVASDNTLYWVLLWDMRGFGQHTLLAIIRSDVGRPHQNIFFFK